MRNLQDWLKAYLEYQENTEPARIFDKWVSYSMIASALRKKTYLSLGRIKIYPNIYVVFVAEPGIARKSQAISFGMELLSQIPEIQTTADVITKEALIEDLELSAVDELMPDGSNFRHASLNIISKEFESFLGQKKENTKMLVFLTDLFDCQEIPWKYRTKNKGTNVIPSVFINLLAATTPDSLASSLPPTAVGGGLTSRILFVWADRKKRKVPRPVSTPKEKELRDLLIKDLYVISRLTGEYKMSKECADMWDNWYNEYEETSPSRICTDPSFNGWYSRKPMYILKVSLLVAASRSNDLIVTWDNIRQSMDEIEELEAEMGNVFKAIGKSVVTSETDTIMQIIKSRKVISEKSLFSLVWRDIDNDKFNNVIETAKRSGKVRRTFKGPNGEPGVWYSWSDSFNN